MLLSLDGQQLWGCCRGRGGLEALMREALTGVTGRFWLPTGLALFCLPAFCLFC